MKHSDIEKTIDRYNRRLEEFGETEKALGWGDKGRSQLRFMILTSQWDFSAASVLDFGCGFGDLYAYIAKQQASTFDYLGIDINPSLIEVARKRYPSTNFEVLNILETDDIPQFDYVLASGTFNAKLENNVEFIESCMTRMAKIARKGIAFNFLSNKVDYQSDITFHADPSEILNLFYRFSKNVVLRNDYMPFEFTVFADLAAKIDDRLTVYENYVKFV
jgi:SAM-dependent methyltransferase